MRLRLWMVLGLVACTHRPRSSAHLFPEPVTVMGHRGAAGVAPENTAAAFDVAAALGVPFELDTMLCGSGELVVIHDEDLSLTTDGSGFVSEAPLASLATLDAGSGFSADFAGEGVPLLGDVLGKYTEQVVVNIEVKGGRGTDAGTLAASVVEAIEGAGVEDRVIVTSFNPFILAAIRAESPAILRGQIYGSFRDSDLRWIERVLLRNLAFNGKVVPDLLMMEAAHATRRRVRRLKRKGYRVFVWTVNDEAEALRLMGQGVDGLITDQPAKMRALVEKVGKRN